jgi:hypothetical protein
MDLTPYDFSLLTFLSAAAVGHYRVSRERPKHFGIFVALLVVIVANVASLALYPEHGLLPILVSLTVPGACLYGVCATHGFRPRRAVAFTLIGAIGTWIVSLANPAFYAWTILFAWCVIAALAWVCLLDPEERATGITQASAVAFAASLLADLPGVYAWAKTGSWKAESVLTSLSVTILATLPLLWRILTSAPSLSDSRCSRSASCSVGSPAKIQENSK